MKRRVVQHLPPASPAAEGSSRRHRLPRLAAGWVLACASALLGMGPALAGEQDQVRAGVSKGTYKPLAAIVADIQKRHPGRVLDVETKRGPQGELRYEITLADAQGRKQELLVDAASGQVLAQEAEHHDQAQTLAKLASHLRRVEQQLGNRVVDAEYEVDHGKPRYKLKLARAADATQKVLMDPQSGALLNRPDAKAAAAIKPMPEVLQALAGQFSGLVLEVELEHDDKLGAYYEIELAQPGGGTLELHVDARTLAILKRKLDD